MAAIPYQQTLYFPGTYPTANQVLWRQTFLLGGVTFTQGSWIAGSSAVAFTATKLFSITKNGTSICAVSFPTGSTTPTFGTLTGSPVTFATGDVLTVVAVGTPDATGAGVAFTLLGTRS
jgi:hypothetical protein